MLVGLEHVKRAIAEREQRVNRPERELLRLIEDDTLAVEPTGAKVGQLYGLAVLSAAEHEFARPIKIECSAFMGTSGVVDIEREVRGGRSCFLQNSVVSWRARSRRSSVATLSCVDSLSDRSLCSRSVASCTLAVAASAARSFNVKSATSSIARRVAARSVSISEAIRTTFASASRRASLSAR